MERFKGDQEYEKLKQQRQVKRLEYEQKGLIQTSQIHLHNAISMIPECLEMCPLFELLERQHQKMVDPLEPPFVKRFARSSAGDKQVLPSDVRTPAVLVVFLFNLENS